ncbi:response regulator transcription factor [Dactylosporangium sp. NPDC051484]|uniref:response regulator transcription factor n=1 Tax=Dactylosporangium sp. NPDC051484 TaxID=3154942 RepID=UPI00344DD6DB
MSIRIVVADDHALVLDAFAETLRAVPGFEIVGLINRAQHVVSTVRLLRPTVAILNMGMANVDVLHLTREVRAALPGCGVALISAKPTRDLVDRAVEAGALSVIPKHARLPYLVGAIRGVASGCLTIDPGLIGPAGPTNQTLSHREREILSLTVSGASVKEIAKELFLSAGTVRNISSTAMRKLKGRNRFDAARIAYEQGWL